MPRESYVFRNGQLIPKNEAAAEKMRSQGIQIIKDIEPYRNVVDRKVVGGRRQHRDFLRAYNLVEVGDQAKTELPRQENRVDKALGYEIKRQMDRLRDAGIWKK